MLIRKSSEFGKKGKLSPRYIGLFDMIEKVGPVSYQLALPPEFDKIHNVFRVSMLRRYRSDSSHVLEPEEDELNTDLSYEKMPAMILDRERAKGLQCKDSYKAKRKYEDFNSIESYKASMKEKFDVESLIEGFHLQIRLSLLVASHVLFDRLVGLFQVQEPIPSMIHVQQQLEPRDVLVVSSIQVDQTFHSYSKDIPFEPPEHREGSVELVQAQELYGILRLFEFLWLNRGLRFGLSRKISFHPDNICNSRGASRVTILS
ncbi:hypothetical protein GQ457_03G015130 [Hibiscus cannabinus]